MVLHLCVCGLVLGPMFPPYLVCDSWDLLWRGDDKASHYPFTLGGKVAGGGGPMPNCRSGDGACSGKMPKLATYPALVGKSGV